ncbi:hypothetical protein LTR33_005768 [Friedmanniomyces endolithicus]|nr:hypothetical protein LTR33_005768 [Friedmanniomyces endolithicus]
MPRLVRRAPLSDRIKTYLDPYDFLLWVSEELNDDAYDEWLRDWATPLGIALNIVFILARGASKAARPRGRDDVFGDVEGGKGSGWFVWFAAFLAHFLTLLCCLNAFYAFFRRRNYRLFEQPVDIAPATPSAHRVKVESSPMSSSPLRYLQTVIASATASSRAYPDAEREVWELAIWDPKPFNLTIFTLFSPGHLLLYFSLLPPITLDPRPSVTILTALAFGALLSLQLGFLKTSFSQQAKDSALVHGEVMNEYDTKFVKPSLNRPLRDVGTQTRESATSPRGTRTREVDIYTPTTIVNRGFRTNPNTNYASSYNPDHYTTPEDGPARRNIATPSLVTPTPSTYANGYTQSSYSRPSASGGGGMADFSSPLKPHHERLRERSPVKGDGGSMGVYSHAASPLRKAASSSHLKPSVNGAGGRTASPLKRVSTPGGGLGSDGGGAARRRETGKY